MLNATTARGIAYICSVIDTLIDDNKMLKKRYIAKRIARSESNQKGTKTVFGSNTVPLRLRDGSKTGISMGARIYI